MDFLLGERKRFLKLTGRGLRIPTIDKICDRSTLERTDGATQFSRSRYSTISFIRLCTDGISLV